MRLKQLGRVPHLHGSRPRAYGPIERIDVCAACGGVRVARVLPPVRMTGGPAQRMPIVFGMRAYRYPRIVVAASVDAVRRLDAVPIAHTDRVAAVEAQVEN